MPVDTGALAYLSRAFTPPDPQQMEQDRYQNAILKSTAQQEPLRTEALQNANTLQGDTIKKNARGVLAQQFDAVANSKDPKTAASSLFGSGIFQKAAQAAGIDPAYFKVDPNDDPELIRQHSADWAHGLGGENPASRRVQSTTIGQNGTVWEIMGDGSYRDTGIPAQKFAPRVATVGGGKVEFDPNAKGITQQLSTPQQERAAAAATAGATETAKKGAELGTERTFDQPRAQASFQSSQSSLDRLKQSAQQILDDQNLWKAVGVGRGLATIPGSAGAGVKARINRLKSQAAFTTLQNMRDNSKTGGALGQVSNYEEQLLTNNLAPLDDLNQSPEDYRQAVQDIVDYVDGSKRRLQNAYEQTYPQARRTPASAGPSASPAAQSGPSRISSDAEFDALPSGAVFIGPDGKTRKKP